MKLSRGLMRLQATGNIGGAKAKLEQTLKAEAVQAGTDAPFRLPGIVLQRWLSRQNDLHSEIRIKSLC